jgi:hypothetical protein
VPIALDEYPIHQLPLPMNRVVTSDRNFYDRCYLNAYDKSGEIFLVTGLGVYPNLGVTDAFAVARIGTHQHSVRFSDALTERSLDQKVGGYQIDVVSPLERLRVRCASPDGSLDFDLHWTGSFPAVQEDTHLLLTGNRPILDASRFSQVGTWEGALSVGGREFTVTAGARDRSWGIRPVGESEPAGRPSDDPGFGFWWIYMPLRFESSMVIVIVQENPDGFRTLNTAKRVWPDGRIEQLGWPDVAISYRPGTREPESARIGLKNGQVIDVEVVTSLPLHVGGGYSGDSEWAHGRWMGRDWSSTAVYDLTDPAVAGRIPFGVTDHLARVTLDGEEGWGMFEHSSMGRHDPSGFADWSSVQQTPAALA